VRKNPVSIGYEAELFPEPVWTLRRKINSTLKEFEPLVVQLSVLVIVFCFLS
jgi:hypothetical protein